MRVNGSFSNNYSRLLEMNKQLGEDDVEEHLLVWSSDVVDTLKAINNKSTYKVVITLEPNPANEKGVHCARIDVWQEDVMEDSTTLGDQLLPTREHKPFIKMMSGRQQNLATCIQKINERMDSISERLNNPNVIEMDGRKYRLVEIK